MAHIDIAHGSSCCSPRDSFKCTFNSRSELNMKFANQPHEKYSIKKSSKFWLNSNELGIWATHWWTQSKNSWKMRVRYSFDAAWPVRELLPEGNPLLLDENYEARQSAVVAVKKQHAAETDRSRESERKQWRQRPDMLANLRDVSCAVRSQPSELQNARKSSVQNSTNPIEMKSNPD